MDFSVAQFGAVISCRKPNFNSYIGYCRFSRINNSIRGNSSIRRYDAGGGAVYLDEFSLSKIKFCFFINVTGQGMGQCIYTCSSPETQSYFECISDNMCGSDLCRLDSCVVVADRATSFVNQYNSSNQQYINFNGIYHAGMSPAKYEISFAIIIGDPNKLETTCLGLSNVDATERGNKVSFLVAKYFSKDAGIISMWQTLVTFDTCYFVECSGKLFNYKTPSQSKLKNVYFTTTKPSYEADNFILEKNCHVLNILENLPTIVCKMPTEKIKTMNYNACYAKIQYSILYNVFIVKL